ncbi:MAG: transcriptional regulator, MarR family [Acidimicrobiales bacterium]|nr:transcriptional regulator, MarR family [Acidimicrobiales bacterium]
MDTVETAAQPSIDPTDVDGIASHLRFSVTRLARLLRQQSDVGLSPTQLAALATIDRIGPMPIGTLAEVEQVAAPTATKAVEKLHAAGYVDRIADGDDRRVKRVAISPDGARLLATVRARKTAWLTTRLADLRADELATLADAVAILERLVAPPAAPPTTSPVAAPAPLPPTKTER